MGRIGQEFLLRAKARLQSVQCAVEGFDQWCQLVRQVACLQACVECLRGDVLGFDGRSAQRVQHALQRQVRGDQKDRQEGQAGGQNALLQCWGAKRVAHFEYQSVAGGKLDIPGGAAMFDGCGGRMHWHALPLQLKPFELGVKRCAGWGQGRGFFAGGREDHPAIGGGDANEHILFEAGE